MDQIDDDYLYIEEPCGKCGNQLTFQFSIFKTELNVAVSTDWQRCRSCQCVAGERLRNKDIKARYAACKARQEAEDGLEAQAGKALSSPETTLSELQEWAINALGNPIDSERLNEIWTILKAKQEAWADCTQCELGPLLEATLDLLADAVVRTLPNYRQEDS